MSENHAIKFYLIAAHFKNAANQLRRGENAYTSGHVQKIMFDPNMEPAYLRGEVQASMKKRVYKVEIYIHLKDGVVSTTCTCPRGQAVCHHMAALLYYAHYNISSTDKAREWGPTALKKEASAIAAPIEKLYPREQFRSLIENIDDNIIEEFKNKIGNSNVGYTWLLKPEADTSFFNLAPSLEDMLFSDEYVKASDKDEYIVSACCLEAGNIKEIAAITKGQYKSEEWLITRKFRLTASKFGVILNACRRNKYPPSLYKSLMEGYDLSRVLAVQWGRDNEETAFQKFIEVTGLNVTRTGLWLHESGFLGASPDGLINDNEILEIKCPYSFRNCLIKEGVEDKKYVFHYANEQVMLDINHAYYHQVQGQLYLTNRERCYFFVWTPTDHEVFIIEKDPEWLPNIEILKNFFLKKFVPAIFNLK